MIFACGYAAVWVGNIINDEKPTTLGNAVCTAGYGIMGASVLLFLVRLLP